MNNGIDFDFADTGSLTLVTPLNDLARSHLVNHTRGEWLGNGLVGVSLVVEPRYAPELSAALCRDGFTVELPNGRVVSEEDLAEG